MKRFWSASAAALVALASTSGDAQTHVYPNAAVATDSAIASAVGQAVLERGGNAADAAVAAALTLGVVQPFASGIGGGGFAVWRGADGEIAALDFREQAPGLATREMFFANDEGQAPSSTHGGLAVAVPGEVAGLFALHERYGALPWAEVVEPAQQLAATGFAVGRLLISRLESELDFAAGPRAFDHAAGPTAVVAWPRLIAEFSADWRVPAEGDLLVRAGLSEALGHIADAGADGFYRGEVAEDVVASTAASGGILSLEDLQTYEPRWLDPLTTTYRGYRVITMPLPSSGGVTIASALRVLETFSLDRLSIDSAAYAHIVIETLAHTFAARAAHLGDVEFDATLLDEFVSDDRIGEIVRAFDPVRTLDSAAYGALVGIASDDGTSHLSVVDSSGNCIALTTTVNASFGSRVVTERFGIVLNNEMDDFSTRPGEPNMFGLVQSEANAIVPGNRPLSSMSPTIVERDGALVGSVGGSGGPMIISATLQTLLALIDMALPVDEAVARPRLHQQWLPAFVRADSDATSAWNTLLPEYGYELRVEPFISAVQAIWRVEGGWSAASDWRKMGQPAGL